jgi:peptide/nickel transport system substrate-binding protein
VQERPVTLLVRDIPIPHYAGADLLAASWKEIGITVTQDRRNIWDWQKVVDARDFDIALDFSGDFYDDPTLQLTKYVSHDLSPVNFAGSTDRFLDALYVAQAMTTDPRQRAKMVRDFERHALTEAYTVLLLWWNRIVATSAKLRAGTSPRAISLARTSPRSGSTSDPGHHLRYARKRIEDTIKVVVRIREN